jgi:hypothetical protein
MVRPLATATISASPSTCTIDAVDHDLQVPAGRAGTRGTLPTA